MAHLFTNHVDRVLDTAVGNDWHNGSIRDSQVADSVDTELRVNHTLVDALRETSGTAGVLRGMLALFTLSQ